MCRLLMSDNRGLKKLGKEYMKGFLDVLEKSCGGHGNGYLFIKDGQIIGYDKGVKLSNEEIVERVYSEEVDWFIYHTRIASKGSIKDENCHPYVSADLTQGLAMNGTMSDFGAIANHSDITDTEMLFKMKLASGLPADNLVGLSPRFLGIENGKVYAVNNSVAQALHYDDNECIIIASEFPKGYVGDKTMKVDYCWHEGEAIEERKVTIYTNNNTAWWDRCYYDYGIYSGRGRSYVFDTDDDISSDIVETLEDLKDVAHDAKSMLTTGLSTDYIKKSITYDWSLKDLKNIKLKDKKSYMLIIKEKAVEILHGKKVVYTC